MKTVDSALNDLLNSVIDGDVDELDYCELFTLTATCGDVLRFTDFDNDLVVAGNTYIGSGLIIPERGSTKTAVGFDVDEMILDFLIGDDDTGNVPVVLNGLTMQQLVTSSFLDKAEILVTRLFWNTGQVGIVPSWAPVHKFGGTISKTPENTRPKISFDVQSHMQKLQRQIPQTVMQPACGVVHYGAECGVVQASFDVACVVASGSNAVLLKASALGTHQPDIYFDKGFVTFTSGKNKGLSQAIKQSTQADGLILCAPMIFTPQIGDTFTATPGCDHSRGANGCAKFSNLARFPGFPYVPAPETAI